jgi:hypothetical protein
VCYDKGDFATSAVAAERQAQPGSAAAGSSSSTAGSKYFKNMSNMVSHKGIQGQLQQQQQEAGDVRGQQQQQQQEAEDVRGQMRSRL